MVGVYWREITGGVPSLGGANLVLTGPGKLEQVAEKNRVMLCAWLLLHMAASLSTSLSCCREAWALLPDAGTRQFGLPDTRSASSASAKLLFITCPT